MTANNLSVYAKTQPQREFKNYKATMDDISRIIQVNDGDPQLSDNQQILPNEKIQRGLLLNNTLSNWITFVPAQLFSQYCFIRYRFIQTSLVSTTMGQFVIA